MTRALLALGLIVASSSAHAISCRDLLLRAGQMALALSGRQMMQEGVPIEWQLLAKDFDTDESLAAAWVEREDRERHQLIEDLGLTVEYEGPSQTTVDFILKIPRWKTLLNSELRSLIPHDE